MIYFVGGCILGFCIGAAGCAFLIAAFSDPGEHVRRRDTGEFESYRPSGKRDDPA